MKRGEVWWSTLPPPRGPRPVVLVSRAQAYRVRDLLIVVPVTTQRRTLITEIALGRQEGLSRTSVANADVIETVPKRMLAHRLGQLSPRKMAELDEALKFALELE